METHLHSLRELPNDELESRHDYIQYMFPSEEASQFNSVAPTVTPDVIERIQKKSRAPQGAGFNFQRILGFGTSV